MVARWFSIFGRCLWLTIKLSETIEAGDKVLASDPETGETAYKEVLKTYTYVKDTLVYVTVDGETIETTKEHPFWVEGQGWTKAKFLEAGDQLRDASGENLVIEDVDIVPLPENQYTLVYNFEVADFHTYYVADSYILVHNDCVEKIAEKITKKGKNKVNYLADDMSSAKNYARKNIVGHNTEKIFGFPKGEKRVKTQYGRVGRIWIMVTLLIGIMMIG